MDINKYTPNLKKYLPTVLNEVTEFQSLCDSENPEFILVWEAVKNTLKDQFLDDLSIVGIERWTELFKMIGAPLNSNGSISDRRLEIKSRVNQDGTYTLKKLNDTLATLCGGTDQYTCELNAENYTLKVRIKLTSRNQEDSVRELLNKVTPANLIIDLSLLYNQHRTLANYRHNELKFSHKTLKESAELGE